MATQRSQGCFLPFVSLALLLLVLATTSRAQEDPTSVFQRRLIQAQQVIAEKGYRDMAYMLYSIQSDLEILELQNKTCTIFAPDGASFWATFDSDPPLSIVRYHIVPTRVDRDLLESPAMSQQKIDTLLQGHPLVVTTGLPQSYTQIPSLNLVAVGEWDIYNDGHLIIHGLGEFFSPGFQTTFYPWFNEPEAPTLSPSIAPQATFSPTASFSRSSNTGGRDYGIASFVLSTAVCILLVLL